jgi:CelD/BcsL family acetyltransferase involved in cellulose biosynthesis
LPGTYQHARLFIYMSYTVTEEDLENIKSYSSDKKQSLRWPSIFVLPSWLEAWWRSFGADSEMLLRVIRDDRNIIGIAPLMRKGETAYFMGSTEVCDYMDFIIAPGMEEDFSHALLDDLKRSGITRLDLAHVRPDSAVLRNLPALARDNGYKAEVSPEETSLETVLPESWDKYLAMLTRKQRHEVRRKLRRLYEAGQVDYSFAGEIESVSDSMDTFIKLFIECRDDKAVFLTKQMEEFFRLLAEKTHEAGLLKLGTLKLDNQPVACIMCFDYNECIYLYNSGYDPDYNHLSAGLLSKVLGVQESIKKGKKRFDFLKGSEPYKYHLGGREVELSRCLIDLK